MPRRQSKFLFACARLARETTHRNPKTDSTLRFRPLDEFYELNPLDMLQKRYDGKIKPVCDVIASMLRLIQDCALISLDISEDQAKVVRSCLV